MSTLFDGNNVLVSHYDIKVLIHIRCAGMIMTAAAVPLRPPMKLRTNYSHQRDSAARTTLGSMAMQMDILGVS